MARIDQDFNMWIGDTKRVIFTVEDADSLVGSEIVWKLARSVKDEPVLIKTSENPEEIERDGNKFIVKIKPEDTEEVSTSGSYYHEAKVIDGDGNIHTVSVGRINFNPALIKKKEG